MDKEGCFVYFADWQHVIEGTHAPEEKNKNKNKKEQEQEEQEKGESTSLAKKAICNNQFSGRSGA